MHCYFLKKIFFKKFVPKFDYLKAIDIGFYQYSSTDKDLQHSISDFGGQTNSSYKITIRLLHMLILIRPVFR